MSDFNEDEYEVFCDCMSFFCIPELIHDIYNLMEQNWKCEDCGKKLSIKKYT